MENSSRRVASVRGRAFAVGLETGSLSAVQRGTLAQRYRGLRFAKNPFDIAIYLQLLERLEPASIIEVGTSEGGSAAWFRDWLAGRRDDGRVLSYDLNPPALALDGVEFARLDAGLEIPGAVIDAWRACPAPRLFIDDSAHLYATVRNCLAAFASAAQPGDCIVVEDGVVADLPGANYAAYEDGPNRAVAEFLESGQGARFRIMEELCDLFGPNVTYCPNAWLRCERL